MDQQGQGPSACGWTGLSAPPNAATGDHDGLTGSAGGATDANGPAPTYIDMMKYDVRTMVDALK